MLDAATNYLRRSVRAVRKAVHYPILLPHHRVSKDGVVTLDRPAEAVDPLVLHALSMCDGSNTLAHIATASGASRTAILEHHDRGELALWRSRLMAEPPAASKPSYIVVSPHPDDASLCLGGFLVQQTPGDVLALDVFTRTAWTRFPTELNDVAAIRRIRWAEEWLMARMAGVGLEDAGLPEAVLRDHLYSNIFSDAPAAWDREVADALRGIIGRLKAQHPGATWCLPLAVGNHLDHRIVRDGAYEALVGYKVRRDRIVFYEDLPYAASLRGRPDFSNCLPGTKLQPQNVDIADVWEWKVELNRVYWSQLTYRQLAALGEYARRLGRGRPVERLWRIV